MSGSATPYSVAMDGDLVQPTRIAFHWDASARATAYFEAAIAPAQLKLVLNKVNSAQAGWSAEGRYHSDGLMLRLYFDGVVPADEEARNQLEERLNSLLRPVSAYTAKVLVEFERLPNGLLRRAQVKFKIQGSALHDDIWARRRINSIHRVSNTVLVNGGEELRFTVAWLKERESISMETVTNAIGMAAIHHNVTVVGEPKYSYINISWPVDRNPTLG